MSDKKIYTEKNIKRLIVCSLNEDNRLDENHKEIVLDMLLQRLEQPKKEFHLQSFSVIGISVVWIVLIILVFSVLKDLTYMFDLIKAALGLSLLLIPVSSFVLIILKLRSNEKRMV